MISTILNIKLFKDQDIPIAKNLKILYKKKKLLILIINYKKFNRIKLKLIINNKIFKQNKSKIK